MERPLWAEAAEQGGLFFHRVGREAFLSPDVAEQLERLDEPVREAGGSFLRLGEFATRNHTNVWLCYSFQIAIQSGTAAWRTALDLNTYSQAATLLLSGGSPYSEELKSLLGSERSQLREYEEYRNELARRFQRRKESLEREFGGPFFGKKLSEDTYAIRRWPYFRQEILNLVSFLEGYVGRTGAFKITGKLLHVLAPEWYVDPRTELVRKRYRDAGSLRPTPIPKLPDTPTWKGPLQVRNIPDGDS